MLGQHSRLAVIEVTIVVAGVVIGAVVVVVVGIAGATAVRPGFIAVSGVAVCTCGQVPMAPLASALTAYRSPLRVVGFSVKPTARVPPSPDRVDDAKYWLIGRVVVEFCS